MHRRIFQTFAEPGLHRLARGRLRGLDREQQIGPGSAVANLRAFCSMLALQQRTVLLLVPAISTSLRMPFALAPFTNLVLFSPNANKRGYCADNQC